jgi:hypothetical protein
MIRWNYQVSNEGVTSNAKAACCTPDRVRAHKSLSDSAAGHGAALSSKEWKGLRETYELDGFNARPALESKDPAVLLQLFAIAMASAYTSGN